MVIFCIFNKNTGCHSQRWAWIFIHNINNVIFYTEKKLQGEISRKKQPLTKQYWSIHSIFWNVVSSIYGVSNKISVQFQQFSWSNKIFNDVKWVCSNIFIISSLYKTFQMKLFDVWIKVLHLIFFFYKIYNNIILLLYIYYYYYFQAFV